MASKEEKLSPSDKNDADNSEATEVPEEDQGTTNQSSVNSENIGHTRSLQNDLEYLRQRVRTLQLHIKGQVTDFNVEDEKDDPSTLLTCSSNKGIRALQYSQQKMQAQVKDVIQRCRAVENVIANLRSCVSGSSEDTLELQQMLSNLVTWKNTLEQKFDQCIRRSEQLKNINTEWQEFNGKLYQQKTLFAQLAGSFVPDESTAQDKQKLIKACNDMQIMLDDMAKFQMHRFKAWQNVHTNMNGTDDDHPNENKKSE